MANKIAWVAPRCGVQKQVVITGGEIYLGNLKESGTGLSPISLHRQSWVFLLVWGFFFCLFLGFFSLFAKILASKAKLVVAAV